MFQPDAIKDVTWVAIEPPFEGARGALYIDGQLVRVNRLAESISTVFVGWLDCLVFQGWSGEYQLVLLNYGREFKEYELGEWFFPLTLDEFKRTEPTAVWSTGTHTPGPSGAKGED